MKLQVYVLSEPETSITIDGSGSPPGLLDPGATRLTDHRRAPGWTG